MLAKQRQKDAIQLVKTQTAPEDDNGDARLFHSLPPSNFFMLSYRVKPSRIRGEASFVDISKLDLNSKIKKFSYPFICGMAILPPRGENSFLSTVRPPRIRGGSCVVSSGNLESVRPKRVNHPPCVLAILRFHRNFQNSVADIQIDVRSVMGERP